MRSGSLQDVTQPALPADWSATALARSRPGVPQRRSQCVPSQSVGSMDVDVDGMIERKVCVSARSARAEPLTLRGGGDREAWNVDRPGGFDCRRDAHAAQVTAGA